MDFFFVLSFCFLFNFLIIFVIANGCCYCIIYACFSRTPRKCLICPLDVVVECLFFIYELFRSNCLVVGNSNFQWLQKITIIDPYDKCFIFFPSFFWFYDFEWVYVVDVKYNVLNHANLVCFILAGLPMSLSSTSNSLKSSGTFNSNSSINSTPSVDRYAALKDLDEQLREIKEKDNHNQNTLSAAVSANPFNLSASSSLSVSPSAQPNPFQTQSTPLWFGEQQPQQQQGLKTPVQPMYPMTNGMTNGNGNGFHDQSTFAMNGSAFNGNGLHYPKVTDTNLFNGTNGFPQKNPFAVMTICFDFLFLFLSIPICSLLIYNVSSVFRNRLQY